MMRSNCWPLQCLQDSVDEVPLKDQIGAAFTAIFTAIFKNGAWDEGLLRSRCKKYIPQNRRFGREVDTLEHSSQGHYHRWDLSPLSEEFWRIHEGSCRRENIVDQEDALAFDARHIVYGKGPV